MTNQPAATGLAGTAEADRRMQAALRLQARFGDAHQRRQAAEPDGPRLPAQHLMALVTSAGSPHRAAGDDRPRPGARDILDAVLQIAQARQDLEQQERQLLQLARSRADDRRPLTWAEIADALGLGSAQAAQQRYRPTTEAIVRNARADEASREMWRARPFPAHNEQDSKNFECLCEQCQQVENRDPG